MSYQVLARKWRPKNFQQLMGQEHVVTVLVNALEQQRLHHAYLFTGTRGVGKTTIARIFAKSLNCQQGVTSTPCGECDTCQDIDLGRFVDLLEIDAASRTKVDDTREILDNVQYAPTRGRYKVYLIDEVHMLSRSSFNALLKTLEEPPEHVKFILATTDPQKLPVTVLSRCLQFHLKALTVGQIEQQLNQVLEAEAVGHESGALTLLAKAARGSMRDALSLTDQSIAQGQGQICVANVQQMLGGVDQNWVYKILIALIKQDSQGLMTLSQEIASYAPSYSRLMAELIQLLHHIAMAQIVDQQFDLSPEHSKLVTKFCQAMSAEDVQLYYQIVLNARKDLPYAADEQAAFDMMLLRLLAFKPMQNTDVKNTATQAESKAVGQELDETLLADTQINQAKQKLAPDNVTGVDSKGKEKQSHKGDILDRVTEHSAEQDLAVEMLNIEQMAQEQGMMTLPAGDLDSPVDVPLTQGIAESNEINANQGIHEEPLAAPMPLDDKEQGVSKAQEHFPNPSAEAEPVGNTPVQEPLMAEQESIEPVTQGTTEPEQHLTQAADTGLAQSQYQSQSSENQFSSPVEAVLATRNMLRSRKKQLEETPKKSNDAVTRQDSAVINDSDNPAPIQREVKNDAPAIETVPEQPYTPEVIDPSNTRYANQVDKWSNMIDTMALNGRIRQLAIHATISEDSSDDVLILNLDQSTKHLKTDVAHKQLEEFICDYLNRPVTVELNIVEQTIADPYQIQSDINDKRLEYATALLREDEVVIRFQEQYQAELDEKSIIAR